MGTPDTPQLTFDADIKPLFRDKDRNAMKRAFDLWSYDDVAQHADAIEKQLKDGTMPCDAAWPSDQVATFQAWIAQDKPA